MKNKIFLITIAAAFYSEPSNSQIIVNGPSLSHAPSMSGPPVVARNLTPVSNMVNINGQDGFYLKKDLYLTETYTIIGGRKVMGTPFLFKDWLEGIITTPDGRVYSDYKLQYNVQNQTVSFSNGTDSLEVNEPVKEFTLKYKLADSVITSRFINSSEYHKGKTFYYEVLVDADNGQLLKTNKKVVATQPFDMIGADTKKYLKLENDFFYYNKTTGKTTKISTAPDIRAALQLTDEQMKQLQVNSIDIANEIDLLRVFKLYLQKEKKAF
jgi:hypothetical protein